MEYKQRKLSSRIWSGWNKFALGAIAAYHGGIQTPGTGRNGKAPRDYPRFYDSNGFPTLDSPAVDTVRQTQLSGPACVRSNNVAAGDIIIYEEP